MPTPKIALNSETFTVPLDRLSRDPGNVRTVDTGAEAEALADDIAMHGLLHNLGVRPDETPGRFLVCIGGRRLAALKHLVKTKRLAKNAPIPCRMMDAAEATSAGLAENLSRVPMHPADAYVAFAALIDQGRSVEQVALRFGVTEQTVERRMRLGRLSPVVLAAFREGQIGEADAKAFAITTDHAAQDRVLDALGARLSHAGAWTIKTMLTEGDVPSHDTRSRFVGLDAYEAAGGAVRRDLFAEHGGGVTLSDVELLNRLALDKLEQVAAPLRAEGWADVTVRLDTPERMELIGWKKAIPSNRDHSPAEAERFAAITARVAELEAQDEVSDTEDEELTRLETEREEIEQGAEHYDRADAERGWAVVYVGMFGEPIIARLVPAAQDDPAALAARGTPSERPAGGNGAEESAKGLTGALTASLLAHRTIALQAHVAARPGLALRLLAQALLLGRDRSGYAAPLGVRLVHPDTLPHEAAEEAKDGPARKLLDELHERRDDHRPDDRNGLLPWLLQKDDGEVVDLLAPLLAEAIDAGSVDWTVKADSLAAQAARAAEYDPVPWWTATPESYFKRVNKEQIGAAVTETGESVNLAAKKAELAAEAARKVQGTGWVPTLLRAPPANDDGVRHAAE